jgi:hypothetical protein
MPIATDVQMQTFANERIRPFAEQFRNILAAARDNKSVIDDIYARATENPGTQWNDARTDGPPHLLKSGYDNTTPANPDDMLNFNSFIAALCDIIDGVGTDATNAATLRTNWAVLVDACVRPMGS